MEEDFLGGIERTVHVKKDIEKLSQFSRKDRILGTEEGEVMREWQC